ncbi:hypothetical protein RclHR1_01580005 [Rhizophagus clarus]|uniref:F-box domain-containing protein n=1 Tax=Rhizophagus clarus TaxID=94130 RepID=A0A2Z6QV55_9GLOM|nr:hypothetical protein RclHR1_01580005 [Rhizophagus clarus]GES78652.1 hypothetical protein GLOIN_2v1764020 [Rhizophagus clarus]
MSKLNKDILYLIFEELGKDSKTLFSCLMVNRTWCETVIPILWRNPWSYDINYDNKNYLFAIIAFYLSDDIKNFLTIQGGLLQISCKSLLFDYLSYCRSINIDIINRIISIGSFLDYSQFLLQQEFYNIFIRKSPEFRYLDMRSIKHQIFYFPEAKIRLESLCEIKCDTSIDSSYFYGLARICQYVQRFIIINKNIEANSGMIKLIEVQKNLKYLEWKDDFDDDYYTDPYEEILLTLEKKADMIHHLKIFLQYVDCFEHTLLQKVLQKLHKLKTLIINDVFIFIGEDLLKKFVYRDLEVLNIDCITLNTASSIIENSGGQIKEILLSRYYDAIYNDDFDEVSLNFIRKIYENCPKIEYLSLSFSSSVEHFIELEKLLKVCKNLKSLLLIIFYDFEPEDEILEIITRSAPVNLSEIRFFDDIQFKLEELEEFFEKWKGRPALSMFTSDPIYKRNDYVELIDRYKNDGVIKEFSCERNIYFDLESETD